MASNKKGRPAKSDQYKVLQLRMRIADSYCKGKTLIEIAKEEETCVSVISKHLKAIRLFWLSHIAQSFDERMSDTLMRIDKLETAAWEGWERSCKDAETVKLVTEKGIRVQPSRERGRAPTAKLVPIREALEKYTKGQAGDPRFLTVIGECIDRRSRILKVTEDQPINNVYLDFSSLLPKESTKVVDVIEHKIAEVGNTSSQEQSLPNGLKELEGGNGETH